MEARSAQEVQRWLMQKRSLQELREAFPEDWDAVEREFAEQVPRGDVDGLKAYVLSLVTGSSAPQPRERARRLHMEVQRRMMIAAIEQHLRAVASGAKGGRLRFNVPNGYVAQKLLFERALHRKPVSLFWFRLWWPLLWQRRYLMPLVEPKGIYCFYSRPLIRELSALGGARNCLEIAAGDGTLTRFLKDAGVRIVATDDHSWSNRVAYPDGVAREEATVALGKRRPQAVICSWPPAGYSFEQAVLKTPSVELYVVIGSRHRFTASNWDDYEKQTVFEFAEDPRLSSLVLPPEIDPAGTLCTQCEQVMPATV